MSGAVQERLEQYHSLVRTYHRTLDLLSPGALRDWARLEQGALAFRDALLEVAPGARTVVDVGSGVGLPGIPMAIALPDVRFLLVERRRRRSAFLSLAVGQLRLPNAEVFGGDVRDLEGVSCDAVTAQAVGSFSLLHEMTDHLHGGTVTLLSRKGPDWQDEIATLAAGTGLRPEARSFPLPDGAFIIAASLGRD